MSDTGPLALSLPSALQSRRRCPHCGNNFSAGTGWHKHVEACSRRPTEEQLKADRADGLTQAQMARLYNVSRTIISKWLQEAGLGVSHVRKEDLIRIHPDLAPFYAQHRYKVRMHCGRCPAQHICPSLDAQLDWVLCEAPDDYQITIWRHRGINIYTLVQKIRHILGATHEPPN